MNAGWESQGQQNWKTIRKPIAMWSAGKWKRWGSRNEGREQETSPAVKTAVSARCWSSGSFECYPLKLYVIYKLLKQTNKQTMQSFLHSANTRTFLRTRSSWTSLLPASTLLHLCSFNQDHLQSSSKTSIFGGLKQMFLRKLPSGQDWEGDDSWFVPHSL